MKLGDNMTMEACNAWGDVAPRKYRPPRIGDIPRRSAIDQPSPSDTSPLKPEKLSKNNTTQLTNEPGTSRDPLSPEYIVEIRKDSALYLEGEEEPVIIQVLKPINTDVPRRQSSGYGSVRGSFDDTKTSLTNEQQQELIVHEPRRLKPRPLIKSLPVKVDESIDEHVAGPSGVIMPTTEIYRKESGSGINVHNIEKVVEEEVIESWDLSQKKNLESHTLVTEDIEKLKLTTAESDKNLPCPERRVADCKIAQEGEMGRFELPQEKKDASPAPEKGEERKEKPKIIENIQKIVLTTADLAKLRLSAGLYKNFPCSGDSVAHREVAQGSEIGTYKLPKETKMIPLDVETQKTKTTPQKVVPRETKMTPQKVEICGTWKQEKIMFPKVEPQIDALFKRSECTEVRIRESVIVHINQISPKNNVQKEELLLKHAPSQQNIIECPTAQTADRSKQMLTKSQSMMDLNTDIAMHNHNSSKESETGQFKPLEGLRVPRSRKQQINKRRSKSESRNTIQTSDTGEYGTISMKNLIHSVIETNLASSLNKSDANNETARSENLKNSTILDDSNQTSDTRKSFVSDEAGPSQKSPSNQETSKNQKTIENQKSSENQKTTGNQKSPGNQKLPENQEMSENQETPGKQKTPANVTNRPIYPSCLFSPYGSPQGSPRYRDSMGKIFYRENSAGGNISCNIASFESQPDSQILNQYKVLDEIGKGSFGVVKKVYNQEDGMYYAMKILSKRKLMKKAGIFGRMAPRRTSANPLANVYREIAILKKLDHPNVVKLVEVLDHPDRDNLYLVFELVHRGEILVIPTDHPLNEPTARRYFRDVIMGVEYLHYQKIVHRDIKPSNLLVDQNDKIKIADLGVSTELREPGELLTGQAGTPAFAAPETTASVEYSGPPCDVWSMGVTLYALVIGDLPWRGPDTKTIQELVRNEPLVFPKSKFSCSLRHLIMWMLEKVPRNRIEIQEMKKHPWVTNCASDPLPDMEDNCCVPVTVTDEEVTKLGTLVLIKTMLKQHSFQNPFLSKRLGRMTGNNMGTESPTARQEGSSSAQRETLRDAKAERFHQAGRSNSAPDSYDWHTSGRQVSVENPLPPVTEASSQESETEKR